MARPVLTTKSTKPAKPKKPRPSQKEILRAMKELEDAGDLGTHALKRKLDFKSAGGLNATLKRMERDGWITLPKVVVEGKMGTTPKARRWLEQDD
jgi:hypothetical protein